MKQCFAAFCCCAALVFASTAGSAANPTAYTLLTERISALSSSPYIRMIDSGKTITGRKIPAYIISDFSRSSVNKPRILIISGQHGNEINPIKALVSFSENLALDTYPQILRNNLILCIPIVNPDGLASGSRYNSLGMDINRCWVSLETSENVFVHKMIKAFDPQIIIDAHEWPKTPGMPGNGIELAWSADSAQRQSMSAIASKIDRVAGLTQIECRQEANKTLFHRRYTKLGYAAFLIETDPKLSYTEKDKAYKQSFLTAVAEAGTIKRIKNDTTWNVEAMESIAGNLHGQKKRPSRPSFLLWSLAPCVGSYLLLLLFRPKRKQPASIRQWKLDREQNDSERQPLARYFYRVR